MSARLHVLVVPALILALSIAYWLQIAGERRSVVLVPAGVLVLIIVCLTAVLVQDLSSPPQAPSINRSQITGPLGLVALCIGYYLCFVYLGFDVANLLFVFAAALLMKLRWPKAAITAVVTSAALHVLAWAMDFNVPEPFWAR